MIGSIKIKPSSQRGQALALAIIVVAITGLLAVPVLTFPPTSAPVRCLPHSLHEQYSVDAATEDAIWSIAYDSAFRKEWADYSITDINGAEVQIKVEPRFIQPVLVPPPPTPSEGINILMWTAIPTPTPAGVPEFDLLNPDPEGVTITIHIQDSDLGTHPPIKQIVEVPPKGFEFAGGLLCDGGPVCTNLVWSAGPKNGEYLTTFDLQEFPFFTKVKTASATFVGGDPWDPASVPPDCVEITRSDPPDLDVDYQKLEWNWPDAHTRPKILQGQEVEISFKMILTGPVDLSGLPLSDNPWLLSLVNQCPGNGIQAGRPLEVSGFFTALTTATQGTTELTSLVEYDFSEPGPDLGIDIQSQRYK